MNWLRRLITLPKSRNSFRDIVGVELWQQWDRDADAAAGFYKACTDYINTHPEDALLFLRELLALLADNARLLQSGLTTQDPMFGVRQNLRAFARKWGIGWNG